MKNQFLFLSMFVFILASLGCASLRNSVIVKPDQVPSDFHDYKDTLLVVDDKVIIGYTKFLKRNFSQYYKGSYKIVSRKDYMKNDDNHFRFVFNALFSYEYSGMESEKYIQYYLSDSQTGKIYKTAKTKYYSELMINYIKELNNQLGKQ